MSSAAGPSAAPDDVLVRRENGVLIVTLNRPQQRNAVNGAVSAGVARALDLLDSSSALRVGVRGGGCSGFSYVIEFHDGPPRPKDRVYDYVAQDGTPVRVVVDPKSLLYLNGSQLDWEQTLMQQGFKFRNPQEKSNCGCGHSFTV